MYPLERWGLRFETEELGLFYVPYFSDHKAHLKSFNFLKNQKCAL